MKETGWIVIFGVVASAGASGACTAERSAVAAPAPRRDEPAVAIEYEVTGKDPGEGVLLRGSTRVDEHHDVGVNHSAHEKEQLRLSARERADGTYEVVARYYEETPNGELHWEPVMHVGRGSSATADVSGAGWARTIRVKLE